MNVIRKGQRKVGCSVINLPAIEFKIPCPITKFTKVFVAVLLYFNNWVSTFFSAILIADSRGLTIVLVRKIEDLLNKLIKKIQLLNN